MPLQILGADGWKVAAALTARHIVSAGGMEAGSQPALCAAAAAAGCSALRRWLPQPVLRVPRRQFPGRRAGA